MKTALTLLLCLFCLLTACVPAKQEKLTIKSLENREFALIPDAAIDSNRQQAIDRYRAFLDTAPDTPLRLEAVRRLADLQLEQGDESLPPKARTAQGSMTEGSDYAKAIQLYQDVLQTINISSI